MLIYQYFLFIFLIFFIIREKILWKQWIEPEEDEDVSEDQANTESSEDPATPEETE